MRTIAKLSKKLKRRLGNFYTNFLRFVSRSVKRGRTYLKKNPFRSVLIVLLLLFIIIAVGDRLRRPEVRDREEVEPVKTVEAYRIGAVPTIKVNGKIEKSHVVTIVAQSAGIVQKINVKPGQEVRAGANLFSLSSNYQGAVLPSVQRQIAGTNYAFQKENLELQKNSIRQNREVAQKTNENADRLRQISRESRGATEDTINISRSSLETIEELIEFYKQSSTPTLTDAQTDESVLLGLNQQRVALLNAVSAAESGLRHLNYSEREDNPPAQLSVLQRDITLKQLDLQEKSLDLNLEIAGLNVRMAQIVESLMYPAAPYGGKIERIFVRPGQSVQPGTPLALISGDASTLSVIALVSREIAQSISPLTESIIQINDQTFSVYPVHIASEPTDGRLFAVTYTLPQIGTGASSALEKGVLLESMDASRVASDGQYVSIEIPVGYAQTSSAFPFIPIDSVFQSQDKSLIFVEEDGLARSREVDLGNVYGRYVEVRKGLGKHDVVLLDRRLIEGDKVQITNL